MSKEKEKDKDKEKEKENDDCCICFEIMNHRDKPLPCCGQRIHKTCLIKSGRERCPLCRSPQAMQLLNKGELKALKCARRELSGYHVRNTNDMLPMDIQQHRSLRYMHDIRVCQSHIERIQTTLQHVRCSLHYHHGQLNQLYSISAIPIEFEPIQDELQYIHRLEQHEFDLMDELASWKVIQNGLNSSASTASSSSST